MLFTKSRKTKKTRKTKKHQRNARKPDKSENAIKTIDSSGKVTSHLDRDKYKRLSTPIKIEMKSLKNYFDNFSEWNFENYLKLNNLNLISQHLAE